MNNCTGLINSDLIADLVIILLYFTQGFYRTDFSCRYNFPPITLTLRAILRTVIRNKIAKLKFFVS